MRARERGWIAGIVPALFLLLLATEGASGQVTAVPQRDLAFGLLMPGVPARVLVDDAARRAEWLLTGRGNTTVSFVLPSAMQGPGGAMLPLTFQAGDVGLLRVGSGGGGPAMQTEDPTTPFSVNVPNRQTVRLFLGGTALPATAQPAGNYTATVTVIIAQP